MSDTTPAVELADDNSRPAGVEPLVGGTFALYDDDHGGFVLVAETTQHGIMRRHIPAAMVKLASKMAAGGNLLGGIFR